jgi:predicted dehydrogenase
MAVRFGLLGTGHWAAEADGAALASHPGVEFTGVWGRDPAKAARLAGRFAVRPYDSVDALLADVDAVAVALPPDVQAPLALRAATAGKHLLLDKPLAFSTAAADRIVAAVEANRLVARVFFTQRYQPEITEFLADLEAGRWDGARASLLGSIFQPGNPYGGSPWRRQRGGLWDIGPHALSVLLPVLGPVAEVLAAPAPHGTTNVLLRHVSGAGSTLSLTLDAPPAATADEVVFSGEAGFATVPAGRLRPAEVATRILDELVRAVAAGTLQHPCDARFVRDVVAVLAAAETASRLGAAVHPAPVPDGSGQAGPEVRAEAPGVGGGG